MSHSLTSHEDLTPYIEGLMRLSSQSANFERRRSFAAEPETIIKELLTELMTSRKNTQTAETIAKKFLEAYNTSIEDQSRLKEKLKNLSSDIGDLNTLIQKYQKEIEVKDSRYESITLEVIDLERDLKRMNHENGQLKKEREFLKKEILSKEQVILARESTMQQRKNILVEVEREKEKEKDKEADKGFQVKYEQLLVVNKKKQAEIEELNGKVQEIEELWTIDKNVADKLQKSVSHLRDELLQKKLDCEEILKKYRDCKDRVVVLKEELMMEKMNNENLVNEYERQKSNFKSSDFENFDENSGFKAENFRKSRSEILSDYFTEFEEPAKSEVVYTINDTDKASPKFMLINTKRTEILPHISVFPARVEKEKEGGKEFQIKFEHLLEVNKEKQAEINELIKKIKEIESLWLQDRSVADMLKHSVDDLNIQFSQKKSEYEVILQKYNDCKTQILSTKEELVTEKANKENLIKEYEEQKKSFFEAKDKIVVLSEELMIEKANYRNLIKEFEEQKILFYESRDQALAIKEELMMEKANKENLIKEHEEQKKSFFDCRKTEILSSVLVFPIKVEKKNSKIKALTEDSKALEAKCEKLLNANNEKQAEIDELLKRLKEIENLWTLDKSSADKLLGSIGHLNDELFENKLDREEILKKYSECKDQISILREELLLEKANNENLINELKKQKSIIKNTDFELISDIKSQNCNEDRSSSLKNNFSLLKESKNPKKDLKFLNLDKSFNELMLINTKRTEILQSISVFPEKKLLQLDKNENIGIKPKVCVEVERQFEVKAKKLKENKLEVEKFNGFVWKNTLSVVKMDEINCERIPVFNFDDAASEESSETVVSRSRKSSVVEIRDPIKEFFIFTCQIVKLNSKHKDKFGTIPVNKLYEKVMKQGVPFNLWNDFITDYLHSRMKGKV